MTERTHDIPILYEDNHLLVVIKALRGTVAVRRERRARHADNLEILSPEKYAKPGNVFLGLIHRLDRPVAG
jgi:23S rRNA pseudouridine1911/1915/1917 synthase